MKLYSFTKNPILRCALALIILHFVALFILPAKDVKAANIIQNPSFEEPDSGGGWDTIPDNWTFWATSTAIPSTNAEQSTQYAYEGNYSVKMYGAGSNNGFFGYYQSTENGSDTIDDNTTYFMDVYMLTPTAYPLISGNFAQAELELFNISGTEIASVSTPLFDSGSYAPGSWHYFHTELFAPPGSYYAVFSLSYFNYYYTDGEIVRQGYGDVYFDAMYATNPEPATIFFLLLGLLGMGVTRRKFIFKRR